MDPQLQISKNNKNSNNYTVTTRIIRTKWLNNLCRLIFVLLLLLLILCNFVAVHLYLWIHNYRWTTTTTTKLHNNTITIGTKWLNNLCRLIFCCCCCYSVIFLLFICNCRCTMADEQQQQQHRAIYINCSVFKSSYFEEMQCRCTPPVEASSGQEQYYIRSSWHVDRNAIENAVGSQTYPQ